VAHPLAVRLMCAARREMRSSWSLVTVVTDLATIHASWAFADNSDRYYVPTLEAQQALLNYGVSLDRIVYSGFPVHPKFLSNVSGREQARQELGIRKDRTTVLVTSGGAGGGKVGDIVSAIETARPNWQTLVVTGNNRALFRALVERGQAPVNTHVYGFVNKMETLMAAADVVVTKAGPGTIMEALSLSRPLIVTGAVGLQETGNISYVENNKFGIYCPEPDNIVEAIGKAGRIGLDLARKQDRAFVVNGSNRIGKNILEQDLVGDRKEQTA
jgi:UDP-N-acetylglucosamine:LPS N-acetylglucosamine transferase